MSRGPPGVTAGQWFTAAPVNAMFYEGWPAPAYILQGPYEPSCPGRKRLF